MRLSKTAFPIAAAIGILIGFGNGVAHPDLAFQAPAYYVSALGNDANDGKTPARAWKTVAKVNSSLPAGAVALFRGGDTFTGTLTAVGGLSALKPTVYAAMGNGRPIISSGTGDGVDIIDVSHVHLSGLEFAAASQAANTANGINFMNAAAGADLVDVFAVGCVVREYGQIGIQVASQNAAPRGFNGVLIAACSVYNCSGSMDAYGAGIYSWSNSYGLAGLAASHKNLNILGNHVYNINGKLGGAAWTGVPIVLSETDLATVERNYVHDCGANSNASTGPVAIWCYDATRIYIRFNHVAKMHTANVDGGAFDIDGGCQNCVIEYNYAEDCDGPLAMIYGFDDASVLPLSGNVVRYNVGRNMGIVTGNGMMCGSDNSHSGFLLNYMYNNIVTITSIGRWCMRVVGGQMAAATGGIFNNIFFADVAAGAGGMLIVQSSSLGSLKINGNDYWSTGTLSFSHNGTPYTTIAAWAAAVSQETLHAAATWRNVDPLFANKLGTAALDFKPTAAGIKNAGVDLNAEFALSVGAVDFAQVPLHVPPPDIGAIQV